MSIYHELADPKAIPLRRLVALTRDYYKWSARTVDKPHSQYHAWYYRLACECERRELNLERIVSK